MPDPIVLVVDTNVIVSASISILHNRHSAAREVFELLFEPEAALELLLSDDVCDEYEDVLSRPAFEFRNVRAQLIDLANIASWLGTPARRVSLLRDPTDNMFLDLAIDGDANYLVTGNRRHYPDLEWIVTPRAFLRLKFE